MPLSAPRLVREPLLHFLMIGSVLYLGQTILSPAAETLGFGLNESLPEQQLIITERLPITITKAQIKALIVQNRGKFQRMLPDEQIRALVEREIDEEILFREALRRRLDYSDRIVRRRLIQNMRFALSGSGQENSADDEQLLQQARDLGMVKTDAVIRRRLIQRMKMGIESAVSLSEAEVRAYAATQEERWKLPERYHFTQRFFSSDLRGAAAKADAESALNNESEQGDPMVWGQQFENQSAVDIHRRFGQGFAEKVASAELGAWQGPFKTTYGFHLILVTEKLPGRVPKWEEIRNRAKQELWAHREGRHLRQQLDALAALYPIEVEWPQW